MPLTSDFATRVIEHADFFELRLGTGPVPDDCDRLDARSLNEAHAIYSLAKDFEGLTGFLAECQKGTASRKLGMPRPPAAGDVLLVSSDRGLGGILPPYMSLEVAFVLQENGELRAIALDNYYDTIFPPDTVVLQRGDQTIYREGYIDDISGKFTPFSAALEVPA